MKLTPQQLKVLQPVREHGLTLFEIAQTVCVSEDATRNVLRRLSENYLRSFPFLGARKIYRPQPALCRAFGLSPTMTKRLTKQALLQRYAVLHFAYLDGEPKQTLPVASFDEQFPDLALPNLRTNYLWGQHQGKEYLMFPITDFGAHPTRIVRKCFTALRRRSHLQAWRALIAEGTFLVVVITGTAAKAQQIRKVAEDRRFTSPLYVHVVPDLPHLL